MPILHPLLLDVCFDQLTVELRLLDGVTICALSFLLLSHRILVPGAQHPHSIVETNFICAPSVDWSNTNTLAKTYNTGSLIQALTYILGKDITMVDGTKHSDRAAGNLSVHLQRQGGLCMLLEGSFFFGKSHSGRQCLCPNFK